MFYKGKPLNPLRMLRKCRLLSVIILAFLACSKEKDPFTPEVSEVDTTVAREDIEGIWFVYAGEYMDNIVETAPNFPECGFDYVVFSASGVYKEYSYNKSDCIPRTSTGNWKIENGIIIVSSANGEDVEFPVIEFGPSKLVINFRYDIDNDGDEDIFKADLRPYDPISNYHITKSFERDSNEPTLLKFNWKQESDLGSFSSYEIYRSSEGNCAKEDAILLAEINDISETTFIDYSPPPTQRNLCYFLRIYSNGILAGESQLQNENPEDLIIPNSVKLKSPSLDGENILLEWDEFNIPYFSHYEIVYANSDGSNLLFHEEDSIAAIEMLDQTGFLVTDPPYLENPFFAIYAYNIFGSNVVSNYEQVTFRRKDLVGPIYLDHIEIDNEEPIVYLYGQSKIPDWTNYDVGAVLRFNYETGLTESYTGEDVSFSSRIPFREPITFPEGIELVINSSNNLHFLNPTSLSEKFSFDSFYLFEEFNLSAVLDFVYTKNGFFAVVDQDFIFVFQRIGEELILMDKQIHYTTHHGDSNYRMLEVNDNEILIGHKEEQESILFKVDEHGQLQNKRVVSLPFDSNYIPIYKNVSFYSNSSNSLINYGERTLYSTLSFQSEVQMPQNLFALGLEKDANYIFASTNNPDWYGSDVQTEFLKREVLLYDTKTGQITHIKTKGYPIRVFENYLGEKFSISIPENQSITQFDVFVEKINIP